MGIEQLSEIQLFQGIFTLIFVIINTIVAVMMIKKYFKYRAKELLTVGLSTIFISYRWVIVVISFLSLVLFDVYADYLFLVFFMYWSMGIAMILWIYTFTFLVYKKNRVKRRLILGIYTGIMIFFAILFSIILIVNPSFLYPSSVPYLQEPTDIHPILQLYATLFILSYICTYIIFYNETRKSKDPEIRLKGKLISIGTLLITAASLLIIIFGDRYILATVLVNIIMVLGSITYYIGWAMPESIKKRLL